MRALEQLKADINTAIDARKQDIIQLGEFFWNNPEPGFREMKTAAQARLCLEKLGLTVHDGFSITGLRADLKGIRPGPTLAILGEMDSLIVPSHPLANPQTGAVHACGHNAHITAMLGAAMALVDAQAQRDLAGTVAFVGCPAEEAIEIGYRTRLLQQGKIHALGGKPSLIADGVFDDVDMACMNHVGQGYNLAEYNGFCMKSVIFRGKATHAADAYDSANALSAANLALHALALLREKFSADPSVRMHGILTEGGQSVNVIPDTAQLDYQLRASQLGTVKDLSLAFDRAVNGCSHALGCEAHITTLPGYCPLRNNPTFVEVYRKIVQELRPGSSPFESIHVSAGSTDMGDLSMIMPVVHAICPGAAGTPHGTDFRIGNPQLAYVENARLLALVAAELLHGKALLGKDIARFKQDCLSLEDYRGIMANFASRT